MAEAEIAQAPEIQEDVTPAEPQEPQPTKRPRGRPPGAKNKVKIVLEPSVPEEPPAPEPVAPEPPVAVKKPRAKKAPEPVAPEPPVIMKKPQAKRVHAPPPSHPIPTPVMAPQTPHETFVAAMRAWQHMAAQDRAARAQHYNNLVNGMFT